MRYITIHCSATPASMGIGAEEIREWHVGERGWRDIGYHFIIRRDGTVEKGRPETMTGAHVGGFNTGNLGVCLVGGINQAGAVENNFTDKQWKALDTLMRKLTARYPKAVIMGHNGWPGHESRGCPSFNWQVWRLQFRDTEPKMPSHWIDEIDHEEEG